MAFSGFSEANVTLTGHLVDLDTVNFPEGHPLAWGRATEQNPGPELTKTEIADAQKKDIEFAMQAISKLAGFLKADPRKGATAFYDVFSGGKFAIRTSG